MTLCIRLSALLLAFALAACGTNSTTTSITAATTTITTIGTLTIRDPWVRASAIGEISAGYMTIATSGAADRLTNVSTAAAKTVELHTVTSNNGVMEMRPVEGGIEIPANGSVQIKPGAFHMMLIGLTKPLNPDDTVSLTLQFKKAGEVSVVAQVRQ